MHIVRRTLISFVLVAVVASSAAGLVPIRTASAESPTLTVQDCAVVAPTAGPEFSAWLGRGLFITYSHHGDWYCSMRLRAGSPGVAVFTYIRDLSPYCSIALFPSGYAFMACHRDF